MKTSSLTALACGVSLALSLAAADASQAQTEPAAVAPSAHGDWTLGQREDWLSGRIENALKDGSLDKAAFNSARLEMRDLQHEESRMKHDNKGELTANQTADLETRLDAMASKIHWANMTNNPRPW